MTTMKLELEIFSSLCSAAKFTINGVVAETNDFGYQGDQGGDAEDYCCADMRFESTEPTQEVLDKYGISKAEYIIVAGQLEEGLSFGSCGWCS
jgi:hypothetical protein